MAMTAQGVKIYRASSVELTGFTATNVSATVVAATTDYTAGGITTAMMISLTNSTALRVVRAAAAGSLGIHSSFPTTAQGAGSTALLTAYNMQEIGCITDFTGPGGAAQTYDVTCLSSTDAKAYMIGLRDEGDLSLSLNYIATDAGQVGLQEDRASRSIRKYAIVLTDADHTATSYPSWMYFNGYCMNFSVSGAVDNAVKANATIRISGPVIYTTHTTHA